MLPIEGEPLLSSSADLNGDGLDEILVIKEDKSDYYLESWSVERKGGFSLIDSFELKELDREPDSIFSGDLNGDMRADLLILSNREAPNILLGKKMVGWWSERIRWFEKLYEGNILFSTLFDSEKRFGRSGFIGNRSGSRPDSTMEGVTILKY